MRVGGIGFGFLLPAVLGLLHPVPGGGGAALRLSWSLSPPRSLEKRKRGWRVGNELTKGGNERGRKEVDERVTD